MPPVYAKLGPVSSGTMLTEDLLEAFSDALQDIQHELALPGPTTQSAEETEERKKLFEELDDLLAALEQDQTIEWEEGVEDSQWLEDLENKLDEFAPPYAYFGASEGDGACFGFWISHESLEEACQMDEVLKLPAGDEWPEDELRERAENGVGTEYVLWVSDHGNMTLVDLQQNVIWEVV